MIGQELLLNKLNSYTLDTLPRSILLLGPIGSGRHTIAHLLANKFNVGVVQIDENVPRETLLEYQQCPVDKLYIIDINTFLEPKQNQFLKFIEEPSNTTHIILVAESEVGILQTILNRCIIYRLDDYTKDQLKTIKQFDNEIIYDICSTPGQLLSTDERSFTQTYNLCDLIVNKISIANWANTLGISTKINYKEEYDKIDFNLFLKTILYISYNEYIKNNNKIALAIYNFTCKQAINLQRQTLDKEMFILNYLLNLKRTVMTFAA